MMRARTETWSERNTDDSAMDMFEVMKEVKGGVEVGLRKLLDREF